MKKIFILLFLLIPVLTFAGCETSDNPEVPEVPGRNDDEEEVTPGNSRVLTVYFSRYGNTDFPENFDQTYDNPVDAITTASIVRNQNTLRGTTEVVADLIRDNVGGDKHLIKAQNVYPVGYDEVISQNRSEQSGNIMPALTERIENIDQYDVIFIGYPVWSSTTPNAVLSFLSAYDLSGKTIVPFATHNGYGAGRSFTAIRNACPNSTILEGLALNATDVQTSQNAVDSWIDRISVKNIIGIDTPVKVTAGNTMLDAVFYDTELAREILNMMPLTVNMGVYGGREYYGSMPSRPTATEEGQLRFDNGDITYCPQNNTIAIFFAQTSNPNLTMRVIPIGRITSDLSVFDDMDSRMEMIFANN